MASCCSSCDSKKSVLEGRWLVFVFVLHEIVNIVAVHNGIYAYNELYKVISNYNNDKFVNKGIVIWWICVGLR